MTELIQELENLRGDCYWGNLMLDRVLAIVRQYEDKKEVNDDDPV